MTGQALLGRIDPSVVALEPMTGLGGFAHSSDTVMNCSRQSMPLIGFLK
ncbi:hypothetical protein J4772_05805 [Cohnella sp. LGH]|nr:hypothetical protein [Cohnella sp. LGH]QTH43925.1 hypothetical protein J4772_05805 [Cohnella sp. LGH]